MKIIILGGIKEEKNIGGSDDDYWMHYLSHPSLQLW